jgi:hypothetical protein
VRSPFSFQEKGPGDEVGPARTLRESPAFAIVRGQPVSTIPDIRVRTCNSAPLREEGDFVLYWMIAWCFGRYDRPWPPERPIFGTVRYMSSDSTRKKYKVDGYVARYGGSISCDHLF